jgi:hypothetical protein
MPRRLTNQGVISMVQLGLSEDVIIAKIRMASAKEADSVSFDTSIEGLKALKGANVPDSVVKVMINPAPPPPTIVSASTPITIEANLPPPEVGVYWKDRANFVLVQGQALTNAKAGGRAGSFFTERHEKPALGRYHRGTNIEKRREGTPPHILFLRTRRK